MSTELNSIAEELFEKVRGRFEDVSLGDENAKATIDPQQARFFNFDYIAGGENVGNITLSIIDEKSLKVYFSKNISDDLSEEQRKEWYTFLRDLRHFSKRNLLSFEPRDITRGTLKLRDLKQQSKADSTFAKDEVIGEGRMYGTSRSSYENEGPVRIIVRHTGQVDPEQRGSRSRHIKSIYLETTDGERRKLCCNSLRYARAMGRHLQEGGLIDDEFGQHITEIALECNKLKPFKNGVRGRTFEDVETQQMVEAAFEYHGLLNNTLKRMSGKKGYNQYKENFESNDHVLMDDFNLDEMRERFVKRVYKDSMDEALPIVQKAYKMKKENKLSAQFENWANQVAESWDEDEDNNVTQWGVEPINVDELADLFAEELPLGVDGVNAIAAVENIIQNDELGDILSQAAKQNPQADARDVIIAWLEENVPSVYQELLQDIGDDPNYPPEQMDEDEESDSIDAIANAIVNRVLRGCSMGDERCLALLKKLGPEGIINSAVDIADFAGPVSEIGSSDVSAWIAQMERDAGIELTEGRVKEVAIDLEELTDEEFKAKYGKTKEEMKQALSEGLTGLQKFGAGAALVGALAGNAYMDNQAVEASPQVQKLEQLYQQALANDDVAKANELEDRIENLKARIELGKGEVLDAHGNPVEPKYESVDFIKRLAGL